MSNNLVTMYNNDNIKKPSIKLKRNKNVSFFDFIVYSVIFVFFCLVLASWDYSKSNVFTIFTFFLNGAVYFYFSVVSKDGITIKRNMYIFLLIFFFFAPLQQYLKGEVLWSENGLSLTYNDRDYTTLNILMLCYVVCFELGYRRSVRSWKMGTRVFNNSTNGQILLLVFVTIICMIISKLLVSFTNIGSSAIISQLNNIFIFGPISCLLIALSIRKKRKIDKICIVIIAVTAIGSLLAFSGDIARFILLGAFMSIVSYIIKDFRKKSIYFAGYVIGFFFLFSALRMTNLFDLKLNSIINFNHVDFDAYQIALAAIKYIDKEGISWGQNILSAIACFIPRSIAPWRFEASGGIIMDCFGSWFKNVSCPIPAEMMLAFGVPGLLILSYLFGWLLKKMDTIDLKNGDALVGFYCIISGVSIYIMRGALLPTFSFTAGICLSYFVLFKFMNMRIKK